MGIANILGVFLPFTPILVLGIIFGYKGTKVLYQKYKKKKEQEDLSKIDQEFTDIRTELNNVLSDFRDQVSIILKTTDDNVTNHSKTLDKLLGENTKLKKKLKKQEATINEHKAQMDAMKEKVGLILQI